MAYDIEWIFPKLKNPSKFWNFASTITITFVGLFSKIIIGCLNKTKVYNKHIINTALDDRPKNIPLLTVSNHRSCFDDPGIWGILKFSQVCNPSVVRWSLAANDICFTNKYHSLFFAFGKCIPVIRGKGVYQSAVDLCIQKLGLGHWVHVFPEGKVNMSNEFIRFKWGVGRMIYESPVIPIIVPIWHIGLDHVLPNEPPYYLHFGKKLTYNYGKPIDLTTLIKNLKEKQTPEKDARKIITDKIQEEMMALKEETENLHLKC